ncbi:MAG: PhnD/SsuA/transferrin family substrate-binding protein [Oscillospiraceae bacterium]|nr:PhnD/SsuA/transferrin family substrate-binding protein [Oscillospiraceae bacterium]
MCVATLTACSDGGSSSKTSSDQTSSTTVEDSAPENSSDKISAPEAHEPDVVNIAALKGPTAMGMTKMMNDRETTGDMSFEFEILAAPDEITPKIAQGTVDIACVPANLGAVLFNKTEGKVQALAVNTLGVLYICENGDTVKSIDDLKGKTIYSAGKGSTPEYALNFIIKNSGLENDVTIEWKSEHAECLAALLANDNSVAMLPQPFVTTAQTKNEGVRVALDLNDEWDKLGVDSSLLTGIVIVRKEFAEAYPHIVRDFLKEYGESVEYVNTNVDAAAELVGKYDIVPAAVAKKAIPNCHIVCVTGSEMKDMLSGYLKVLFDNEPKSVGGTLPTDAFYFVG